MPLLTDDQHRADRTQPAAATAATTGARRAGGRHLIITCVAALAAFAVAVPATAATTESAPGVSRDHAQSPGWRDDLIRAYIGTAPYHYPPTAIKDGYAEFPEGVPLHECIEALGSSTGTEHMSAMGVHWVNGALLDGKLDAANPEVLVYEPQPGGGLRLVALEYVVFESAWGSPDETDPPQLFGRDLQYVAEPNRYDIPAFYEIHAWIWDYNPDGLFANMNPRATCTYA